MKLFYVALVITVTSGVLFILSSGFMFMSIPEETTPTRTADASWTTTAWTTPGPSGVNLNGKMFTLSRSGSGVRFYPTNFFSNSPGPSTPSTQPTPPFRRGVSVCLRYLSDPQYISSLFTLSSSPYPLTMRFQYPSSYYLSQYPEINLRPDIRYWSNIDQDIWTRVCFTVDNVRNVAQVFSGFSMSIRKILSFKYVWPDEPVIDIPGFDGQVTDLQVWDYPLLYKEVFNYMTRGVYMSYQGNVFTWSSANFSLSGNALLEDIYEVKGERADQQMPKRRQEGLGVDFYEREDQGREAVVVLFVCLFVCYVVRQIYFKKQNDETGLDKNDGTPTRD